MFFSFHFDMLQPQTSMHFFLLFFSLLVMVGGWEGIVMYSTGQEEVLIADWRNPSRGCRNFVEEGPKLNCENT